MTLAAVAVRLLQDVPQLMVRDVAAALDLSEAAVYKHWRRRNPGTPPRGRRFTTRQLEVCIERFAELCDAMHDCLIDGMSAAEWLAATRDSYGTIAPRSSTSAAEQRRFFRGVERLIATKRVARDGERCKGATYRRLSCER